MLLLSSCLQSSLTDDGTEAGSMWLAGVLFPMPTLGKGCSHGTATCTQDATHVTGGLLTGGHAGVQSGGRLRA